MAELTFKSPGVSTREIDLSGPTAVQPTGVPAGVIGTAVRGPAFVPVTVATFQDFVAKFGNTDGEKFGPLAMNEWLRSANAGTYVRILGIGDGKKRTSAGSNAGKVTNAGFVVGGQTVQGNGFMGNNPHSDHATSDKAGPLGRTYFLGAFHSASAGSTFLSDAGLQGDTKGTPASATFAALGGGADRIKIYWKDPDTKVGNGKRIELRVNAAAAQGAGAFAVDFDSPGDRLRITVRLNSDEAGFGTIAQLVELINTGDIDLEAMNALVVDDAEGLRQKIRAELVGVDGSEVLLDGDDEIITLTGGTAGNFASTPIIRGVLMAPSGVNITMSTSTVASANNIVKSDAREAGGGPFGDVNVGSAKQEFALLLNGHKKSDLSTNVITASFDPSAPNYISKVINTDPTKIEEQGIYLHSAYDVYQTQAIITGSGVTGHLDTSKILYETAFLLSGSEGRDSGTATSSTSIGIPNFENFQDRFTTAFSPFVMSQKFGGKNENLFRIHALDDGRAGSDAFKITIDGIQASTNENDPYGKFNLQVRFMSDSDAEPVVLESFRGLDLNPSSENFIGRRIGDRHTFYDFDKSAGAQKIVVDGTYPNVSNYIRVELDPSVDDGTANKESVPVGFRGLHHLVTSGSTVSSGEANTPTGGLAILTGSHINAKTAGFQPYNSPNSHALQKINQPPVPMRESVAVGVSPKKTVNAKLTWGVQFEKKDSITEPNRSQVLNDSIRSFTKYFPSFHTVDQNAIVGDNEGTPDIAGCVLDADRYNNNAFSLEKVQIVTTAADKPDAQQWAAALYRRNGQASEEILDVDGVSTSNTRLIDPSVDFKVLSARKFLKFTFPLQGGFDGVNIFDKDKSKFTDAALRREMDDSSNQGGKEGPTVGAYRKAISVMEEKSDVDIQLLAIPGVRHESVTDFAIDSVERRFDALYIMDLEERDTLNNPITGSGSVINVKNTVDRQAARNMDSSFAATYFPDVVITDPATQTNVQCPPSVAVLGAFAFNDSVAHPWFAPAGFNRGALSTTIESQVKLNRDNLDDLYEVDINPITAFPSTPGVIVFGQKTLLAAQSALDRVNVRRLLIDVRRKVKTTANSLLFEPNREDTLAKFSNAVTPILSRIQQQQGLDRFKVQIDTTTTTQADVENNTIRGKIFLQPTRSVEFISLDFVVTNAGQFEQA